MRSAPVMFALAFLAGCDLPPPPVITYLWSQWRWRRWLRAASPPQVLRHWLRVLRHAIRGRYDLRI